MAAGRGYRAKDPSRAQPLCCTDPKTETCQTVKSRVSTSFEIGSRARIAQSEHNLLPALPERLAKQPVHMDKKAFGRLKRGKMHPEAKLDLHGMTQDQAHPH